MAEAGKWSDYYITEKGRALRQRCISEKKTVAFVRASIGTGRPASTSAIDTMENLVSFNKIVQYYKSYAVNTNHFAVVRVDNTGYTQEILMSEVGIFAKEKDEPDSAAILYGYAYNLSSYVLIPEYANGNNHKVYEITFDTALSQSTSVEMIYDGSPIYATHHDLEDATTTHNKNPQSHPTKISMPIETPLGVDLNNYTTAGMYYRARGDGGNVVNAPSIQGTQCFSLLVEKNGRIGIGVTQTVVTYWGDVAYRVYCEKQLDDGSETPRWGDWIVLSSRADLSYYVEKTGNDNNDGSASSPFLTVSRAIALANRQKNSGNVYIHVKNGTYTEDFPSIENAGSISLIGQSQNGTILKNATTGDAGIIYASLSVVFQMQSLTIENNAAAPRKSCVIASRCPYDIRNCTLNGNSKATYGLLARNSTGDFDSNTVNNTTSAVYAGAAGLIACSGTAGIGNSIAYAASNGIIMYATSKISATTLKWEGAGGLVRP